MSSRSTTPVGDRIPPVRTADGPTDVLAAATLPAADVLAGLGTSADGLTEAEAASRLATVGPNMLLDHGARAWPVLLRQLRSPLLVLLALTALLSFFLGERVDAVIIGAILLGSVLLSFSNEYRAERAAAALHSRIRHSVTVRRAAAAGRIDVVELVPGDIVHLRLGEVVPADLRLLSVAGLLCDESMLTGESVPVSKRTEPLTGAVSVTDLGCCALMGTIVHAGAGVGAVVATGRDTEFGRIAAGLSTRQPETEFQRGLRSFSMLLLQVAGVLTSLILIGNVLLRRPLLESVLFSLAIAVGITPQLLPAVVSTSLATGSRRLAEIKVLVKRLVCIEDLGDLDVLVTDKTGTLTEGRLSFDDCVAPAGGSCPEAVRLGMLCSDVESRDGVAVGGNALDVALFGNPLVGPAELDGHRVLASRPFDHDSRTMTVVVQTPSGRRQVICKGAPETVLARCAATAAEADATLTGLFAGGARVVAVAVATLPADPDPAQQLVTGDLTLVGFLSFADRPKADAAASLRRLADLGVDVKVATGDNPLVAQHVCAELGMPARPTLTGAQVEALDDAELTAAAGAAGIFARVSPEQKARIVRLLRGHGRDIGFLGDGVNDALALHAADVGISVDTAADVAKDAADVVLLEKDLGVLADGVSEGRRIFANTMKYVLMGTSSNFGNMFSAAGASAVLSFLPMLPSQILLNNLLYDVGQLTIPTDRVDVEQLRRPSHWDIAFIRRFMLFFGPISSMFDFLTFGVMLGLFHARPAEFRTGWFVESLATQTLVIFAVRTRRVPFLRSRPSAPLLAAILAVVALGTLITVSPLAGVLGFSTLPAGFYAVLALMVVMYLGLIEAGKTVFFTEPDRTSPQQRHRRHNHRVQRRASRFSSAA